MPKIKVSISIDDAHVDRISEVVKRLKSAGLEVGQILTNLGVIGGSINSEEVDSLSQIEGVQHIEPEQSYQIAPPDSDVQ